MKKRFITIILAVCTLMMVLTVTTFALDENTETLTIKGDGVSKELTFTRAELKSMTKGISKNIYSTTNNFPTTKIVYREGIELEYLLELAGIRDNALQIKVTASDGYARTFTRQELLEDDRYCFNSDASKSEVPTIVAFSDSGKSFDLMRDVPLVLTMGQRMEGEQNNPWFVKSMQTIEVSNEDPGQWAQVTFTKTPGPDGVTVELRHPNFDSVKIYYTIDGTNPTINSKVYNVSASYYQPELNKPIVVAEDTEIRAIAIGAGKNDSMVSSTAVTFDGAVFNDLADFPWARIAIEDLARKGIINGIGNSQFAPGEPLTRAQFAKIIVMAMGENPTTAGNTSFSDVKPSDWHYGYIEKALELGLISGDPDGSFRPNDALSRQEMLAILVRAMGVDVEECVDQSILKPFINETRISDWARGYVAYAESIGLLEHGHMAEIRVDGISFDARKQASRADAALTVYRMLKHLK